MLRLFRAPFSTNVERVALALAHKGLEVESVVISYEDRSPVVRGERSGARARSWWTTDVVVPDSVAILRYLEESGPTRRCSRARPRGAPSSTCSSTGGARSGRCAPNAIEAELERDEPDRARVKELGARMHDSLDLFERLLDGRDHLFGETSRPPTAPRSRSSSTRRSRDPEDDELFHRILEDNLQLDGGFPRLSAWIDRVNERPRV